MFRSLHRHGQPPLIPSATTRAIFHCAEGDSITQTGPVITYPNLYAGTNALIKLVNHGVPGDSFFGAVGREATNIALIAANPGYTDYYYSIYDFTNDLSGAGFIAADPTGANSALLMAQHLQRMKAGGYTKVFAATMPDLSGSDAYEAWLPQFAAHLRALCPAYFDGVIDFNAGRCGVPGRCFDRLWNMDGTHWSIYGQRWLERDFARTLNEHIAGAVAPANCSSIVATAIKANSISLEWEPPTSGGYWSDYILQYRAFPSDDAWATFTHAAMRGYRATVSGLTAGTAYVFRAAVTGANGQSAAYAQRIFTTLESDPNTFDPATCKSNIFLSNGNATAEARPQNTGGANVLTNRGATGKNRFEWRVDVGWDIAPALEFGLSDGSFSPSEFLGTYANTCGDVHGAVGFTKATGASFFPLGPPQSGDYVTIEVDVPNKKAWYALNNTFIGSGNPAAGTNPTWTWTGSYPKIFGAVDLSYAPGKVTFLGGSPHYTPSTGFSPP